MIIGDRTVGGSDLFFLVEEGMANMGDFEMALRMVSAAKGAGADALEFQFYLTDEFCAPYDGNYDLYRRWQLSVDRMQAIVRATLDAGLLCSVAVLSPSLVAPLKEAGCSLFNINATDMTNPEIIDAVSTSGLPFFLSNLISDQQEIAWAIERIRRNDAVDFAIMHGQHTMFSKAGGHSFKETELGCLQMFREEFSLPVGFIDHTPSTWMPACAVAAGAVIISKHLAIDRSWKGPDWHICLEPEEMRSAIADARDVYASMRVTRKTIMPGDKDRSVMRKSIVAAADIAAGTVLERSHFRYKRPGTGLDPMDSEAYIGKRTVQPLAKDQQIQRTDIEL